MAIRNTKPKDKPYRVADAQGLYLPVSEGEQALRRLGYSKEQMTAHGFHTSASSLLNESGKWNPDCTVARLHQRGQYGADCQNKTHLPRISRAYTCSRTVTWFGHRYKLSGAGWGLHDTVTSTPNLPVLASRQQLKSQFRGAHSVSDNVPEAPIWACFFCLEPDRPRLTRLGAATECVNQPLIKELERVQVGAFAST